MIRLGYAVLLAMTLAVTASPLTAQLKAPTPIDPGIRTPPDFEVPGWLPNAQKFVMDLIRPRFGEDDIYQLPLSWAAFSPQGTQSADNYVGSFNGYLQPLTFATACFGAPVQLPDGAEVAAAVAYAIDNSASSDASFFLIRQQIGTSNLGFLMASLTSTGASPSLRLFIDNSISQAVIDNFSHQYYAYVCLEEPNHLFYTFYITYRDTECGLCGGHME